MSTRIAAGIPNAMQQHPVLSYFVLAYAISWFGAVLVVAPQLLRHEPIPKLNGIVMFPVMLLGPSTAGLISTRLVGGRAGFSALLARMHSFPSRARWFLPLLIPPCLIAAVLLYMKTFVSAVFAPGTFMLGIAFGIPAGLLEEIGWTGFVFPKMCTNRSPFIASVWLGLLWGLWHLPAIDFLGTATPHGQYLLPYFIAFTAVIAAIRVLIGWIYLNSNSIPLAQMMHASSTGALVMLSPPRVNAAQEVLWYCVYATALWLTVGLITVVFGRLLSISVAADRRSTGLLAIP